MSNPNTTTTTTNKSKEIGIGLELTRKLLLFEHSQTHDNEKRQEVLPVGRTITSNSNSNITPRITHEALQAASFLLERFISEARQRALLEAEFDHEKHGCFKTTPTNSETNKDEASKRLKFSHDSQTSGIMKDTSSVILESNSIVEIQQEHVFKIAAEMLLDFC